MSPSLLLREEYNDNILLSENDEEEDYITTVRPGIGLEWKTKVVDLSLDYGLSFRKYLKNPEKDETSFSQVQRAQLDSTFMLYRDVLFLEITDVYARVPIDESGKGGLDNELINLTDSNRLRVNPYLQLPLSSTLSARLDYAYENLWYEDEEGDDAEIHSFEGTLSKEMWPDLTVSLSAGETAYRPDDEANEYDSHKFNVGVSWQATSRLGFKGSYGRVTSDYRNRDKVDSDLHEVGVDYQITDSLSTGATYERDVTLSINRGQYESKRHSAYLSYSGRLTSRLEVYRREAGYIEETREDLARGVSLGGTYSLSDRTGLAYTFALTRFRKDPERDRYERFSGRLEWYYDLRLGRFSAGYTHNDNDSNHLGGDYANNVVWVQLRFDF